MFLLTHKGVGCFFLTVLAVAGLCSFRGILGWLPEDPATFVALAVAAGASVWYAWLTQRNLRAQYTPILVATFENNMTVVRNFGSGAGINVSITDHRGNCLSQVPNLGPGEDRRIMQNIGWTISKANYLFYQDVYAHWYGTKCLGKAATQVSTAPVANVFRGRIVNVSVPPQAKSVARVRSGSDFLVQRNRSWDPRNWVHRFGSCVKKRWKERRIVSLIRAAIEAGRLPDSFTPTQVSETIDLERLAADRFLPNHVVGNENGEREFFRVASEGVYQLK